MFVSLFDRGFVSLFDGGFDGVLRGLGRERSVKQRATGVSL